MSNENEIGNDGADQLWVENDGADDLGGASRVGCDLGSGFTSVEGSSLSLSLFAHLTRKWFEVKIFNSNHFRG